LDDFDFKAVHVIYDTAAHAFDIDVIAWAALRHVEVEAEKQVHDVIEKRTKKSLSCLFTFIS